MCEKIIKLSLDQARKMYGKNPEMDELLLANFSKEELTKKELPKNWKELNNVQGWKISAEGAAVRADVKDVSPVCRRGRFATEKQAKSALAAAQLSQLMAVYNDGWEQDWSQSTVLKNVIYRRRNTIAADKFYENYEFLAFKTAELRDEFLKNFEPLIKEYFMID